MSTLFFKIISAGLERHCAAQQSKQARLGRSAPAAANKGGVNRGAYRGSGRVQVNEGTLRGQGTIAGAVTVGTGSGTGAVLSPGKSGASVGTLTIQSQLTFNSDATCNLGLKSNAATADEVIANEVTINSGAPFSIVDLGNSALPLGTVLTPISNTAATPIAGTFNNLADGSTFTVNGSRECAAKVWPRSRESMSSVRSHP